MLHPVTAHPGIASIRRCQKAIARDYILANLSRYPIRPIFEDVAHLVVEHFFPQAVQRGNTANVSDLVQLMVHAFVLAPLEYRLPGVYRPDWGIGTVLSWFRRCLGKHTGQWYWCMPDVVIDRSPQQVHDQLTKVVHIRDTLFVDGAVEALCNLACSGGRKSEAARQVLDPFAAASLDISIDDLFNVRASSPIRRKLRASGRWVASYLRKGERAVLIADAETARASASGRFRWNDIRVTPLLWQDYVIEWINKDNHLRIRLDHKVITSALREIKQLDKAHSHPRRRFAAITKFVHRFLTTHRYATGSLVALQEFNHIVGSRVAKSITATVPSLVYPSRSVQVYDKLVLPITNPFLTTSTGDVAGGDRSGGISNATWLSFWNPYRSVTGGLSVYDDIRDDVDSGLGDRDMELDQGAEEPDRR